MWREGRLLEPLVQVQTLRRPSAQGGLGMQVACLAPGAPQETSRSGGKGQHAEAVADHQDPRVLASWAETRGF